MARIHNKHHGKSMKGELDHLGIGFDFNGVKDIISDLQYLKDTGIYDRFFYIFKNWENPISVSTSMHKKLQPISPLLTRAVSNGLTPEKGNIFSGSIDYFSFYHFYRFLEWVYSMNLGRYLHKEDVKAIFSSDILEKIILGLENFEHVQFTNHFNDSFFQNINEVKWTDKHTENFFDNLHNLIASKSFDEIGAREISFQRELKRIVKLLAVCNTIDAGRIFITTTDVIIAYKTLFKIIGSNITDLVNKNAYEGLFVCPKCSSYYYLQKEETPDDFVQCSCGGTLIYAISIEEAKQYMGTFKEMAIDKKGLIAGAIISLTFALIFNNIFLPMLLSGIISILVAKKYTRFKSGFLTGIIFGALLFIAFILSGTILLEIKLNQMSSIDGGTIFLFIMVLGVLAIYCGKIGAFLIKGPENNPIIPA